MKTEISDTVMEVRRYRPEDVPLLFGAVRESLPELSVWMPWCHAGYSLEDATASVLACDAEWAKDSYYNFVIWDRRAGLFAGSIGINSINRIHNFANLGYWVRTRCTGRGFATLATRLVAKFGFEGLDLNRLEIVTAVANQPSQRVAVKAGATREGLLRNRLQHGGRPLDAVMYSLIPSDLERRAC